MCWPPKLFKSVFLFIQHCSLACAVCEAFEVGKVGEISLKLPWASDVTTGKILMKLYVHLLGFQ